MENDDGLKPRFMSLNDVATELNITYVQASALVRRGDLPAIRIGGRGVWRVERSRLEEYVERMYYETQAWLKDHPRGRPDGEADEEE